MARKKILSFRGFIYLANKSTTTTHITIGNGQKHFFHTYTLAGRKFPFSSVDKSVNFARFRK